MKKNFIFFSVFSIVLVLGFTSCKETKPASDITLEFSTLPVEQQKQQLEQNGFDFINQTEALLDSKALTALMYLSELTTNEDEVDFPQELRSLSKALKARSTDPLKSFRKKITTEESVELSVGEWNWDADQKKFVLIKELENKMILHYPYSKNTSSNNVVITLSYINSDIMAPDEDFYLPSAVSCNMVIDTKTVMSAQINATYAADATPLTESSTLTIDSYSWTTNSSNSKTNVLISSTFTNGSTKLFEFKVGSNGTFDLETINESKEPGDVLNSANVSLQIMDVGVEGNITEIKKMIDELDEIEISDYGDDYDAEKARINTEKAAEIINKYFTLYAYFIGEYKKFADVTVQPYNHEEVYSEHCTWNDETSELDCTEITRMYYDLTPALKLDKDGSKVQLQNEYFDDKSFEAIIVKLKEIKKNKLE